jgi:long-chain acyl-CoA synthetase
VRDGRPARLRQGLLVNFVVRNVKKMVPEFSLPNAHKFLDVLSEGLKMNLKPVDLAQNDVAFLQYTGGTTGVSKGATLLHKNIIANMLQSEAWYQPAMKKLKPGEQVLFIVPLPLYHIFALTVCAMLSMRLGGHCVLIPNPRDIPGFVKELGKYKFNVFPAVNTLFNALLNNEDFRKLDFSRLIFPPAAAWRCRRRWPSAGWRRPAARSAKAMACPRRHRWRPPTAPTPTSSPAPSACRCRPPTSRS